ncbi:MAG: double-strand break repair helicase AddA [Pseudomonadota bacterium]
MTNAASQRQTTAASPQTSTWLSANAGSGKTRVLTDRVARLLLGGVEPQHILCLTYTKAAASEMQNRLFKRLGEWAMKPDAALRDELAKLGEAAHVTAHGLSRARQLFARAIETPGGLRIQTIHSFCATILRRFPLEAGVSPGFRELDDRAARLMRAEIVEELAEDGAPEVIARLAATWTGEDIESLVEQIARERGAFATPLNDAACRALFDVPAGVTAQTLAQGLMLGDEADWLPVVIAALQAGSVTDNKAGAKLAQVDPSQPDLAMSETFEDVFLTGAAAKEPFSAKIGSFPTKATQKRLEAVMPRLDALMGRVEAARPQRIALMAAEKTAVLHGFAAAYLPRYAARKAARGVLDFDDLITRARGLLTNPSLAAWVLYRLDGGIDHILVDEAQDTSPEQWGVINALAAEFTAGDGGQTRQRTLFVVGDKKQSIYSFQGADVAAFDQMRDAFQAKLETVNLPFQSLSLDHSFRSSPAILALVDATFRDASHAAMGGAVAHLPFKEALEGRVDLWPVIPKPEKSEDGAWFDPIDMVSEEDPAARLAAKIAAEIDAMITSGTQIPVDGGYRPMHAGDVLILVQRRSALFTEVIRACKARGLPIAGADRLKLGAELAVKDLAALLSFLALPEDDLSLAAVLRSPLFGWSEAQLYTLAQGRKTYLWEAMRAMSETHLPTLTVLQDLRDRADFLRPFELIERMLTRHDGRRKLLARLGPEAEDGIDELLSQALAYEQSQTPSLTGFLIWLETDEVEVKRQMDGEGRRIRVMTVHGAKGLEAPVVILPDTADRRPQDRDELYRLPGNRVVWKTPASESPALIAAEREARTLRRDEENLRLLYVALTRARCWLIVAAAGEVKSSDCWYNLIAAGAQGLTLSPLAGGALRHQFGLWPDPKLAPPQADIAVTLPDWVHHPARDVPGPVKPLSPSGLGGPKALPGDPGDLDEESAKLRGRLLHLLLEHLPAADPGDWSAMAEALIANPVQRAELLAEAAGVLSDPALAPLFAPGGLAEVAITADLHGQRLSGSIDLLILTPGRALIVDFKSNRVVPATAAAVPEGYLRQMGAYAHAVAQIYPDRQIDTSILWTRAPHLMALDPDMVRAALLRTTIP